MKKRICISSMILLITMLVQFLPASWIQPVAAATTCDAAQFIGDITVPDGMNFSPGAPIVKTWRLKNVGTCTWTTGYSIVFTQGSQMGAPSTVYMPYSVAPGATVDVTVNMTAPTTPGQYRGYWKLANASGTRFGVGPYYTYAFFIDIVVSTTYSSTYDFVSNYCSATWTSAAGVLPCPGTDGAVSGFVLKQDAPLLETGTTDAVPGLFVGPQAITDGYISGAYPPILVQTGDRFQATLSCAYGVTACYVKFRLDYQIGSGPITTLWSFREKTEGSVYRANVDLSSLAGQNVKFILRVDAYGSPTGDRVLWGGAKLARSGGSTPIVSSCDAAAFVTDVSIPDGTSLSGGAAFTKTWRVTNIGTCTWTTSYKLVFSGGDYMGASASSFNLPSNVLPGQTIDLSVNLTAPITSGTFSGYWKLRNAAGTDFGVGASGTAALLVSINVGSAYDSVYDFTNKACEASWSSGAGVLPCPGTDGDTRGFVLKLGSHQMEDGITSTLGLVTFPQNVTDGYIKGVYPAFAVQNGDHFQAYVGCQKGGPADCYVNFRLDYQIGSGPITTLKSARERLENLVYRIDVDLSSLAGQNVNFILMVQAYGSPSGDRAVWSSPRIVRIGAIGTPAPTATGSPTGVPTSTAVITGPNADLTLTITDGKTFYTPGDTSSSYTVIVTNNGPQNVTGATFSLTKPTYVTEWTVTCAPDTGATCTTGPVTLASTINDSVNIPAAKRVTYTISYKISASAVDSMVATATITNPVAVPDPNLANNSVADTNSPPSADLEVSNTDGVTIFVPGGTTTYTIVVKNNGPLNVTNATFFDAKPTQITSWIWSCAPDSGAVCLSGSSTLTGNFSDVINIPAGKKVIYTVVSTISPAATGNLVNVAQVTSPVGNPDPLLGNNTATDTDTGPSADLAVSTTDGVTWYSPGGTVTYTIRVSNNGPQDVLGAVFVDTIPSQIANWQWSCLADLGAICTAGPSTIVTNYTDTVSIPSGKGITYTVVANINPAATGNLVNTATITSPGSIPDLVLANNSATDTDAPPSADLSVTKSDGRLIYTPGGTTTYTITIRNNGPADVVNAQFADSIPAQVTSWIWTCTPDAGASCSAGPVTSSALFWEFVSIPSGKKITYTVVASIDPLASGAMTNNATIVSPASIPDYTPGNNTATDIDSQPSADLTVTNTDMVLNYTAGGTVIYTIVVTNAGPSTVTGAVFTDNIPGQITSWTWTCVATLSASCTSGPVTSAANFLDTVTIPPGKKVTYTVVATISPAAVGPLVNTANITNPLSVPDPNMTDNTATDTDTP